MNVGAYPCGRPIVLVDTLAVAQLCRGVMLTPHQDVQLRDKNKNKYYAK